MVNFGDLKLDQGQKWEISQGKIDKTAEKKSWAGKLWDVITGKGSLTNIFRSISTSIQPMKVNNRSDADDAVALVAAVEKTYSKTGTFFKVVDGTLHCLSPSSDQALHFREPKSKKEAVLDKTYEKLKDHFFPKDQEPVPFRGGDERTVIDVVYKTLTKDNPSDHDFIELELMLNIEDKETLIKWYGSMAHNGYPAASERLMQFCEEGVIKEGGSNPPLKIYEQAAKQGSLKAQLKLEDAYRNGNSLGVEQNPEKAHAWAVKAQKDDGAWLRQSVDIALGRGVDQDPVGAAAILKGIVEHSKDPAIRAEATYQLGCIAAAENAPERAKKYYAQAKEQGSQSASLALDKINRNEALAKIENNPNASAETLFKAANFLDHGIGGDKDTSAAKSLYLKIVNTQSAEQGDLMYVGAAGYRLGEIYEDDKEYASAVTAFEKAGEAGTMPAAFAKLLRLERDGLIGEQIRISDWVSKGASSFIAAESSLAKDGATNVETARKTVEILMKWKVKVTPDNFAVNGNVTQISVLNAFQTMDVEDQRITSHFLDIARAQGQPITQEDLKSTSKALFGNDDERSLEITALLLHGLVAPKIEDPTLQRAVNVLEVCMKSIRGNLNTSKSDQEGIFRISIDQNERKSFENALTLKDASGEPVKSMDDLASILEENKKNVHYAPSIFKLTLRNLLDQPEASQIMPSKDQTALITNKDERNAQLKELVMRLPPENRAVLKNICSFLNEVAKYKDKTKMDAANLATVIGPNMLTAEVTDPSATLQFNKIMVNFIENQEAIFGI